MARMKIAHSLIANLRQLALRFEAGELLELLSTRSHAPYLARHRIAALVTRVRLVAFGFSGLTLLWIALDAITLPTGQWLLFAAVRLLSVGVFLWLAFAPDRERTPAQALGLMAALLTMPMLLYGLAQMLLREADLDGLAAINAQLYEALPFIVLAGLSIFPLVMVEGVLLALPVLGAVALAHFVSAGFEPLRLISTLWVLGLALGVYLLACATQLHYMMALLHRASYDPLTGALTRRSGVEVIELQFRLAAEQDAPLAIAFLDIDKFKSINDAYGHEAGDRTLRDAAAALHGLLRKADAVIRWGGEEFVILLSSADDAGVRIVMERILAEWLGRRPDGAPLTASIGVAERRTDAIADWVELVKLADERMYVAKQTGRARCVLGTDRVLLPPAG